MKTKNLFISEDLNKDFFYHLSESHSNYSLCKKGSMITLLPLDSWDSNFGINESWCERCKKLGGI